MFILPEDALRLFLREQNKTMDDMTPELEAEAREYYLALLRQPPVPAPEE